MLTITFDKGTENERSLTVQNIFEHPLANNLSAGNTIKIESAEDFPGYDLFYGKPNFSTLEIVDDSGMEIPTHGSYNHIGDFSTSYFDETMTLSVNILLDVE